mgnify:CR=1
MQSFILFNNIFYSSAGASTGQTPAHVPQPMHVFSSIMYFSSPCEIHPTGHSAAHAPQDIHLSDILYAIFYSPPFYWSLLAATLYFFD